MADRVEVATVTVPAGTAPDTPISTDVSFPPGTVTGIEVVIPDGHAGLTGLALGQAGSAVIPATPGAFLISNDEKITWDISGALNNGDWQAICYNRDGYDHTFYLRFLITEISDTPTTEPLPAVAVSA
jgi:hypothetical protein